MELVEVLLIIAYFGFGIGAILFALSGLIMLLNALSITSYKLRSFFIPTGILLGIAVLSFSAAFLINNGTI